MTDHERIGTIETVLVNGKTITGRVYHVRFNGWACVEINGQHLGCGPKARRISMSRYHVALTLEIEATNEHDALVLAARGAYESQHSPGVMHCHIATEAQQLFNDEPFNQMRGQIGMES